LAKLTNTAKIKWITRTAILLSLLLAFQMLGLPQPVTGPVINFILLFAIVLNGFYSSLIIGSVSPVIAFARGILPAPLGPMIPFIILANLVYITIFALARSKTDKPMFSLIFVIVGSLLKYLVLSSAVSFFVSVPPPIAQAMSFPQLITALLGGLILLLIEPLWKKTIKRK
jgi:hypothetical protein